MLDDDVFPLNIAEFAKALTKRIEAERSRGIRGGAVNQKADPRNFPDRLLRFGHRPSHCRYDVDNDKPAPFSMFDCRFSFIKVRIQGSGRKFFFHVFLC